METPEANLKVQEWLVNVDPLTNNNNDDDQTSTVTVTYLSFTNYLKIYKP